jgi:hypothetical protein
LYKASEDKKYISSYFWLELVIPPWTKLWKSPEIWFLKTVSLSLPKFLRKSPENIKYK